MNRMGRNFSTITSLGIAFWLILPATLLAQPTFEWQNSFGVRLDRRFEGDGQGSAIAAFGASATDDGQITDIGAAGDQGAAAAAARAESTANACSLIALADANVFFWRTFTLSDGPGDWTVSLDGVLNGVLSVQIAAPSSVQGKVRVVEGCFDDYSEDPPGLVTIDFGSQTVEENEDRSINLRLTDGGVVPNGTYTVMGALWTSAHANCGAGDSSFFDPPGLVVTIDATPRR